MRRNSFSHNKIVITFLYLLYAFSSTNCYGFDGESIQENRRNFANAINLMEMGDFDSSEKILKELATKTSALRVRLELARVLFLNKKYSESRILFNSILEEELPLPVRQNIASFLKKIESLTGESRISFGFISDTNPRFSSSAREINLIFGKYVYNPEFRKRSDYGIGVTSRFPYSVTVDGKIRTDVSIVGRKFINGENDQVIISGGITFNLKNDPEINLVVNHESFSLGGDSIYNFPSISLLNNLKLFDSLFSIDTRMILGRVSYTHSPDSGGNLTIGSGVVSYNGLDKFLPSFGISYERFYSEREYLSFYGIGANAGFLYKISDNLISGLRGNSSQRFYQEFDPFFGISRMDQKSSLIGSIELRGDFLKALQPAIEIGFERNRSNIEIFSYRRFISGLFFNYRF